MAESSRAAWDSGATASNDASASNASTATSTRSRSPAAWADDGDGQHGDDRHAGDEHDQAFRDARRQRVSPREPDEGSVCFAHTAERLLLASVHDELGSPAQELDELRVQVTLRARPPTPSSTREPPGDRSRSDSRDEQSGDEDDRGDRKDRGRDADSDRAGRDRDERRSEAPQVQALERVHVADHPADEIASPIRLEPCRRERLDALVEANAQAGEDAKGEVVRGQPFEVAGERPREGEESNRHDRPGEGQDRGAFGRTRDEIAGGRHQADAEDHGRSAERDREREPSTRCRGESDEPTERSRSRPRPPDLPPA